MVELTKKWRVKYVEMDRGSAPDYFYNDFDSKELAEEAKARTNSKLGIGPTPDYYVIAEKIEEVFVDDKGRKFKQV